MGISQIAEDVPLPAWPVQYQVHERGYSPLLTIQVPDDITLKTEEE
ncbi:hypothetical protein [Citrobacter freundii]